MLERFIKFSYLIGSIHKSIQKILCDEMGKYNLKGAHAQYLIAMLLSEENVTASKLAEACDNDKAAVSRAIADLIDKGLVRKEGASYRARLSLTEEGKNAAEFVCQRAQTAVELAGITDENREVFYSSLKKLEKNLKEISKKGIENEGKYNS